MLINSNGGGSGGLSLGSLGGVASLMGINTSSANPNGSLATYLSTSNPFYDAIVEEFKILEREEFKKSKTPISDSRMMLSKKIEGEIDEDSGVFTLSFKDIDPVFAQSVVNFAVDWLSNRFDELGVDKNKIKKENLEKNIDSSFQEIQKLEQQVNNLANSVSRGGLVPSIALRSTKIQMELEAQEEVYKQLKTQYELLKVEMQSEMPVFQIIERPEVADKKTSPSRGMFCIIIVLACGFFSVFLSFLLNAIQNVKHDPEAMGKLNLAWGGAEEKNGKKEKRGKKLKR